MKMEQIAYPSKSIEIALDEADAQAVLTDARYSHDEVFGSLRELAADPQFEGESGEEQYY